MKTRCQTSFLNVDIIVKLVYKMHLALYNFLTTHLSLPLCLSTKHRLDKINKSYKKNVQITHKVTVSKASPTFKFTAKQILQLKHQFPLNSSLIQPKNNNDNRIIASWIINNLPITDVLNTNSEKTSKKIHYNVTQ